MTTKDIGSGKRSGMIENEVKELLQQLN